MEIIYELLIVGAGPGGVSLALEAENAGIHPDKLLMIEKSPEHSWTIRKLYHDSKKVTPNYKGMQAECHGVMCLNKTLSKEGFISFVDQAIQQLKIPIHYNEEVTKIKPIGTKDNPLFEIHTTVQVYKSKLVGIATGIFSRPKKPDYPIPTEVRKYVHFDVSRFASFEDPQRVMIVGGGDSAAEFAQYLVELGYRVTLTYRKSGFFRMNHINRESVLTLFNKNKLEILYNHDIESLTWDETKKVQVNFKNDKNTRFTDHIVYALGGSTPRAFLENMGIHFKEDTPLHFEGGETNIPGLFITGDLRMGLKGGSILTAYNASSESISKMCEKYLDCKNKKNATTPL